MQRRVAEIIDSLLTGVVERVVALVSRVEGTYEFEVQPLREYFAAKYLYETAPYAPATRNQTGTKPDRFDGIAPNPYWMNVTRFFAGCFSKGELLDLGDRTARLIEGSEATEAAYPRTLALCLLQDWVFTQSSSAMKRILEATFDKPGIRWGVSKDESSPGGVYGAGVSVGLSPTAGFENLVDHLWPQVVSGSPGESLAAVCQIIRRQPEKSVIADLWYREAIGKQPAELRFWCTVGNWLAAFKELDFSRFKAILMAMDPADFDWGLAAYVQAGGDVSGLSTAELHQAVIAILNGVGDGSFKTLNAKNQVVALRATDPMLYVNIIRRPEYGHFMITDINLGTETSDIYPSLLRKVDELSGERFEVSFSYWRGFFGEMRSAFGKTWREYALTNIAVATKDPTERGAGANSLFDENYLLLDRLRNARRRPRQEDWWKGQYGTAVDASDRGLWILASFSWMHPESFVKIVSTFNRAVQELDDVTYYDVLEACRLSDAYAKFSRNGIVLDDAILVELSWRTKALLHTRLPEMQRKEMDVAFLRSRSKDGLAGTIFLDSLTGAAISGRVDLAENIRLISSGVRRGILSRRSYYHREAAAFNKGLKGMRHEVIKNSSELPSGLVAAAHSGADTRRRFPPVMEIAEEQEWFDE